MKNVLLIMVALGSLAMGCIGMESEEPPIVGIRNMYNQPRYDTQEKKPFFADHRSMRPGVEGSISRVLRNAFSASAGRREKLRL